MSDGRHIDLDVEDLDKNKTSLHRYAVVLGTVFLVLLSIVGLFALARAVPYEPLIIYDYYIEGDNFCPFEEVPVYQELEIVDKWWYTLDHLDAELYMSKDGRPYLDADVDISVGAMPRDVYPSSALRVAPPIPGEWTAESKGTLYGRMFGIVPVQQEIEVQASPPYQVADWSEEGCALTGEED